MLGDANAGKTSLLHKFTDREFKEHGCTVGIDIKMQRIKIDKRVCKFQIWDTVG
jgi:small GTP-binding protein